MRGSLNVTETAAMLSRPVPAAAPACMLCPHLASSPVSMLALPCPLPLRLPDLPFHVLPILPSRWSFIIGGVGLALPIVVPPVREAMGYGAPMPKTPPPVSKVRGSMAACHVPWGTRLSFEACLSQLCACWPLVKAAQHNRRCGCHASAASCCCCPGWALCCPACVHSGAQRCSSMDACRLPMYLLHLLLLCLLGIPSLLPLLPLPQLIETAKQSVQ